MKNFITTNRVITLCSVLILIAGWQITAIKIDSQYIMPSPLATLNALFQLITSVDFWTHLSTTLLRGLLGFLISLILAIIIGTASGLNNKVEAFFLPIIVIMRSTPVIAFILLLVIWVQNFNVPIIIAIITMFPLLSTNITQGIKNTEKDLLQMSQVFKISFLKKIRQIYFPSVLPFLFVGIANAAGFGWRAVIIGEALAHPRNGMGYAMYNAQIYLVVADLIAWSVVAVLVGYSFEKSIKFFERKTIYWK